MGSEFTSYVGPDAFDTALRADQVHTVRICFPDHYGVLRGARYTAEDFDKARLTPQSFCDGAMVWDIRCEIFEEVNFSNYRTGYPDLYARPDLDTLRPCGWSEGEFAVLADSCDAHGEPLAVDPRSLLKRVIQRTDPSGEVGVTIELHVPDEEVRRMLAPGRATAFSTMLVDGLRDSEIPLVSVEWDRTCGRLSLGLLADNPMEAADTAVLVRSAAREVSKRLGVDLTAIPRLSADGPAACLQVSIDAPSGLTSRHAGQLADVELLLRPLPLAHAGGVPPRCSGGGERMVVNASSEANPYFAIAATLMASVGTWEHGTDDARRGYGAAIERFASANWVREWLGDLFVHDALALARRELEIREAQVSRWDLNRYWECG